MLFYNFYSRSSFWMFLNIIEMNYVLEKDAREPENLDRLASSLIEALLLIRKTWVRIPYETELGKLTKSFNSSTLVTPAWYVLSDMSVCLVVKHPQHRSDTPPPRRSYHTSTQHNTVAVATTASHNQYINKWVYCWVLCRKACARSRQSQPAS